jgi:hypothetical protein
VNRLTLTKIHMLLAAFIFPVALMFLVTGGFYTWGIKGSYVSETHQLPLDQPLTDDQTMLVELTEQTLQQLSIAPPSGGAKVKKVGTSFQLEWTGRARDVVLEPTADPLVAKFTVKETNWYRNFVQLHKAKGGQLFKFYAAILAVSLFSILLSGFLMAMQIPKYRKMSMVAALMGIGLFIVMVSLS